MNKRKISLDIWFHKASGQWAKKVRGTVYLLGKDKEAAFLELGRIIHCLKHGLDPYDKDSDRKATGKPISECLVAWLTTKQDSSDLTYRECEQIVLRINEWIDCSRSVLSINTDDLDLISSKLKHYAPAKRINYANRVQTIFRFINKRFVDRPIDWELIEKPRIVERRKAKSAKGKQMWTDMEIRELLSNADIKFRAIILLSINMGLHNKEIWRLPKSVLNLTNDNQSFLSYDREKTGTKREGPLWPETVRAIKKHLKQNPNHTDFIFLTSIETLLTSSQLSKEFRQLRKRCNVNQSGTLIWFRKTFRTIAQRAGNTVAADALMGHTDSHVRQFYLQEEYPDELKRVTDCVREWLHPQDLEFLK